MSSFCPGRVVLVSCVGGLSDGGVTAGSGRADLCLLYFQRRCRDVSPQLCRLRHYQPSSRSSG